MSEEIQVDKVMDLKGLPCPMPVVKVSKGIKEVEVGQTIEAIDHRPRGADGLSCLGQDQRK